MFILGTRGDRDLMIQKARGDDVEMQQTLINGEEKVDLHVPDSQPR